MNERSAMQRRVSRRTYLQTPIRKAALRSILQRAQEYETASGLRIVPVIGNGAAFSIFRRSYGMFTGVQNYFAMVGRESDEFYRERIGYFGERLVIAATSLELGTCWVGGTYSREACPVKLTSGEVLECIIVIGNVLENASIKERIIRRLAHRSPQKTPEQLCQGSDEKTPEWFKNGLAAAAIAPSALNHQPVRFSFHDSCVTASVEHPETHEGIDLGIAKCHFEIGAGSGHWEWGNGAQFKR